MARGETRGIEQHNIRLQTLIRLRWLAVAGQSATIVGVHFGLGFNVPLGFCLSLVTLSAWLNLVLRIRYPASQRLSPRAATALLAYDILQLGGLLYLTGGLLNPFALLFIVPVVVSASALPLANTIGLGVLALLIAGIIGIWHWPLPWYEDVIIDLPVLLKVGIWAGLASCISFVGIYARRISAESMALSSALTATELALAREHHLSALDGLAAATAHELGTPLATIHLVVSELAKELHDDDPLVEDVGLILTQSRRCREILSKLSSLDSVEGGPLEQVELPVLIDEITGPHRGFGIDFDFISEGNPPAPRVYRDPGILYGLGNIVENATDFARAKVSITMIWTEGEVIVEIRDDGPGFPPATLDKLGDPYIGSSARRAERGGEDGKGLGLGVFIAKTLLERSGARIRFANAADGGAIARVKWPRGHIDRRNMEKF